MLGFEKNGPSFLIGTHNSLKKNKKKRKRKKKRKTKKKYTQNQHGLTSCGVMNKSVSCFEKYTAKF